MNYRTTITLLCAGIFIIEAPVCAIQPTSWLSAQDKRTIFVAAGTTMATWGILSLTQKLFTRMHREQPQKNTNEQEQLTQATQARIVKLEEGVKKLKENALTLDASGAAFGLFRFYGILDKDGNFTVPCPEEKLSVQSYAIKNLKIIASAPGRVQSLEKTAQALQQATNELKERIAQQGIQLQKLLAASSTEDAHPDASTQK